MKKFGGSNESNQVQIQHKVVGLGPNGIFCLLSLIKEGYNLEDIIIKEPRLQHILEKSRVRHQIFRISPDGQNSLTKFIPNEFLDQRPFLALPLLNIGHVLPYSEYRNRTDLNFSVSIYELQDELLKQVFNNNKLEILKEMWECIGNCSIECDRFNLLDKKTEIFVKYFTSDYSKLYLLITTLICNLHYKEKIIDIIKLNQMFPKLYKIIDNVIKIPGIRRTIAKNKLINDLESLNNNESVFVNEIFDERNIGSNIIPDNNRNILAVLYYLRLRQIKNDELELALGKELTKPVFECVFLCHGSNDNGVREVEYYKELFRKNPGDFYLRKNDTPNNDSNNIFNKYNLLKKNGEFTDFNVKQNIEKNSYAVTITFNDIRLTNILKKDLENKEESVSKFTQGEEQHNFRWFPSTTDNTPHYLGLVINETDYDKLKVLNRQEITINISRLISNEEYRKELSSDTRKLFSYIHTILNKLYPYKDTINSLYKDITFSFTVFPITYQYRQFPGINIYKDTLIAFLGDSVQNVHFFSGSGVNNGLSSLNLLIEGLFRKGFLEQILINKGNPIGLTQVLKDNDTMNDLSRQYFTNQEETITWLKRNLGGNMRPNII